MITKVGLSYRLIHIDSLLDLSMNRIIAIVFLFLLTSNVFSQGDKQNISTNSDTVSQLNIIKAKEFLQDKSFMYFNVRHITDSITENGGKIPYFLDWLFKRVKGMNGTYGLLEKHNRTMIPEADALFDVEGPSFKYRPIIWIVDDKFLSLTGTRGYNLKYKAFRACEQDLSVMINKICKVYISKENDIWKPWFKYDNLSYIRPITIFIYTNKSTPLCDS